MPNNPAFSHPATIHVAGKNIKVWTGGTGPALPLLHSAWGDAELSWSRVWNDLSASFHIIAPDMPGFGGSDAPAQPSLPAIASTLKELLDVNLIKGAIVVGNSFGAAVAIEFAATFPEYTDHLVLVNGTNLPSIPAFMRKLIGFPLVEDRFRKVMKRIIYGDRAFEKAFPESALLPHGFFEIIRRHEEQHSRSVFNAFMLQGSPQTRPSVPSSIIWGTGDRLVSVQQREGLKRWLKDTKFVAIKGAGHMPQVDRPGEFVEALRNAVQ